MSKNDEKFQQQILFSEVSADEVNDNEGTKNTVSSESLHAPVYFEEDDFADEKKQDDYFKHSGLPKSKTRWLPKILTLTVLVLVVVELFTFVTEGMQTSPIITSLYCVVIASVFLMLSKLLVGEFSSLRQYKKQRGVQEKVNQIVQSDAPTSLSAQGLCESITTQLPSDLSLVNEEFVKQSEGLSEPEIIALYSRQVLSKVDEKALAEVTKYASETVVLISLSPIAILDMILMLWRNLTMLDKIAGLYGLKLTYWSRIALIKEAFKNMLYAGASELMIDFGSDALGNEIVGKLSTRMAQGLGVGMLTARLGLKAMYVCRPVPFEDAPKISSLRKHVLQQIKALIVTSSKDK